MLPDGAAVQTHPARYCECPAGFLASFNPRVDGCLRCGRLEPPIPPWEITRASAGEFYQRIAETMAAGWDLPCSVRALALERFFKLGLDQYGNAYLLRDNAQEGKHEGCDATNYALMEWHRLFLEDELDEGDVDALRGLLLEAAMEAAKMYEKFAEYQRRLHEARAMVPKPQPDDEARQKGSA